MIRNYLRTQNSLFAVPPRQTLAETWRFAVVLAMLAALLPFQSAHAQQQRIYIPLVAVTQRNVVGSGDLPSACALSQEEAAAAKLIAASGEQRRAKLVCNSILAQVARARAKDMAEREYFSHVNPDGVGPNMLVVRAGYDLPDWYSSSRDANNIESIAAGYATAQEVFNGWQGSDGHRKHILGLNDFYKGQEMYGVGYYYDADSEYGHYWVFLSAHEQGVATTSAQLPEAMP